MIRQATLDDMSTILAMGHRFIADTKYAGLVDATPEQLAEVLRVLLGNNEAGAVLVVDRDACVVGMIAMTWFLHPFTGQMAASELFWWVDPEHRGSGVRLLRTAEKFAREHGAHTLQMGAPNDRVSKVYEALGYTQTEVIYQRQLKGRVA